MATSKAQRAGIWVIAVALTVGTVAGFIAMIIAPQNQVADQQKVQAAYTKYQQEYEAYQKKADAQAAELSKKYYPEFKKYANIPEKFDAKNVKEIAVKDLKKGTGATIDENTAYSAYYIGWNPKGKIFDQSIDGKKLKSPIKGEGLIEGWTEGMKGMKIGGVRVITIPSDKAYGEQGSGEDIPANTPIKFVVMAIEQPTSIKEPEIPQELLQ